MTGRPRILVVARRDRTGRAIARQLEPFLRGRASVDLVAEPLPPALPPCDLVLVSTMDLTWKAARLSGKEARILVARRTLRVEGWQKILALPLGTRAMLVNDAQDTALETLALLHELGVRHLELVPVYPGCPEIPPLPLAITPGERELVPSHAKHVIDVGDRVLTPGVVIDILSYLGLYDEEAQDQVGAYLDQVVALDRGLRCILDQLAETKQRLEQTLHQIDEAVIYFDRLGRIVFLNHRAESLLQEPGYRLLGRSLEDVFGASGLTYRLKTMRFTRERVEEVRGRTVLLRTSPVQRRGEILGGLITMREVSQIRSMERALRARVPPEGHVARYTFRDIVGQSRAIQATVALAQRLAQSHSPVLITGESGTGKELFAHAIHNASPRRLHPFVAINCAAVPQSLLETELFGYEEGAFTGARRGGKEGLFELAHLGTVFLDEVGDMSPEVQARLLRVLQDGEVMRVGGTRVRRVDVRVIAATNRPLEEMVRKGQFRADLYHRLNVLPLSIPPLRERKEDIPLLVAHFLRQLGDPRPVSDELLAMLMAYSWPGNVRELRNAVEYMSAVAEGVFGLEHLPSHIRQDVHPGSGTAGGTVTDSGAGGELTEVQRRVLREIARETRGGAGVGRRRLTRRLSEEGLGLGEGEVRRVMRELQERGLIRIGRGRAAARLTFRGYQVLGELDGARLQEPVREAPRWPAGGP